MVASHSLGSVYHHTAFGRTVVATVGHVRPYYIALIDARGECTGGLAVFLVKSWLTGNRLVSVPWACYGDPLVDSPEEFNEVLDRAVGIARECKARYLEIRAGNAASVLHSANMTPVYSEKRHFLNLAQGIDAIWDGLNTKSIKQRIARANRCGIKVRSDVSEGTISSFYAVFVEHRRRLGLPPQKPEYFHNILRHMVPRNLAQYWVADLQGQCVGGVCCLLFNGTMVITYTAVHEDYRRCGVGQYLYWSVICAASQGGVKVIDLGKTASSSKGLLSFKRAWGGVEVDTPVFYYPELKGVSLYNDEKRLSYRAMRGFWRLAPRRVSQIASRFFYRHF